MTPDKINTMIPEIHEMKKQLGEWDGLPPNKVTTTDDALGGKITEVTYVTMHEVVPGLISKRNAFIASKLDAITIDAAKAMEAKREGKRVKHDYGFIGIDTLEANLASVAIRTMDMMGFYGVEWDRGKAYLQSELKGRDTASLIRSVSYVVLKEVMWSGDLEQPNFSGLMSLLLRIAELEQIDLEWHIEARLKYEGGE